MPGHLCGGGPGDAAAARLDGDGGGHARGELRVQLGLPRARSLAGAQLDHQPRLQRGRKEAARVRGERPPVAPVHRPGHGWHPGMMLEVVVVVVGGSLLGGEIRQMASYRYMWLWL